MPISTDNDSSEGGSADVVPNLCVWPSFLHVLQARLLIFLRHLGTLWTFSGEGLLGGTVPHRVPRGSMRDEIVRWEKHKDSLHPVLCMVTHPGPPQAEGNSLVWAHSGLHRKTLSESKDQPCSLVGPWTIFILHWRRVTVHVTWYSNPGFQCVVIHLGWMICLSTQTSLFPNLVLKRLAKSRI